jgi:signal transduction histidine kinase
MNGSPALPAPVHIALYRVAQEALNNVVRHAKASSAWVSVDYSGGAASLDVRDDGCGFERRDFGAEHIGLKSMQERTSEVGADLDVSSAIDEGTHLVFAWRASDSPGS